jgi:hypothetical protein
MATDKKHIAVYLPPEVEQALIAFCQEKGLISKKGTMYSAGVNAALAQFFGISGSEASNTPQGVGNTPPGVGNIPPGVGNIPSRSDSTIPTNSSNIPVESLAVGVLPGKLQA